MPGQQPTGSIPLKADLQKIAGTQQSAANVIDPANNAIRVNIVAGGAGGGGGGAVTIADAADVNAGATTDTAVTSDVTGTLSAKLRGLVKILASVWDSANGRLKVDGSAVTQPVSAASLPLPSNAATSGNQATGNTSLASIDGKLATAKTSDYDTGGGTDIVEMVGIAIPKSGGAVAGGTASDPIRTDPTGTTVQPVSASSLPLPTGAATEATLGTRLSESDFDTKVGSLTETAPASDTASSGLNGRLQRIAQRLSSLLTEQQTQTTSLQLIDDSISTTGSAVPAKSVQISGTDGTNARVIAVTSTGIQRAQNEPTTVNTYSATNAAFTPPATPTDMVQITGSATKTVRVLRIEVHATQTTAAIQSIFLTKRSTAGSGGTAVTATNVAHDSTNSSPTAVVKHYTANPTVGTLVGNVKTWRGTIPAPASANITPLIVWDFTDGPVQPVTLRGVAETLNVNFNGAALPAGLTITVNFIFTETT